MVAIPFPLSTAPGNRPQESGGRLINAYAEPLVGETGRAAVWRRMPGLKSWGTSGKTGFRGMIAMPGIVYAGYSNFIVSFPSGGGSASNVGTIVGTDKLIFARDGNSVPNVVAVSPSDGAFIVRNNGVIAFADSAIGQPNSVCWLRGYFFFSYGNGRCVASNINSTDINANNFTTAESNPDGLYRAIPFNSSLLLFGPNSCEFYSSTSVNDTGFPFNYITSIPHGLAGRYAVAGHEDGYGKALLWVGNGNRVHMLKGGYDPVDVSPADLDRLIAAVSDKNTLEASVHISNGIPWWVISSDDWTWAFNLNTLKWSERASYGLTRWRGTQTCFNSGNWLIGDTETGNVFQIDADTKDEIGDPLRFRVESQPVSKFPRRIRVARADFDMTTGLGAVSGASNITDPAVEISWCDDGLNWSNPLIRPLGHQANAEQRVTVTRTGISGPTGRRWRIDVVDPVQVALMGGDMNAELRSA